MSDKTFVDTNVLIYAHDVDAARKHEIAKDLLRTLWLERTGMVSTQVLQEFYVNATRKIRKPLTKPEARTSSTPTRHGASTASPRATSRPPSRSRIRRVSDSGTLIVAVAARAEARRVLSEDLNNGQSIAGISIHNPFKEKAPPKPRR